MKRLLILPMLLGGAFASSAIGVANPGKGPRPTTKGGQLVFHVVTASHGCDYRPWTTDTIRRGYKVRQREDGSYTVRQENEGRFVTLAGKSPSADPCAGVIRRGKHGRTLRAGKKGTLHGYLQGTVTGGTFNPNGSCTAQCTSSDFIAGFFTSGSVFTCNEGYTGCRFSFEYTAQRHQRRRLRYRHWIDRGLEGVHEVFIGDIASS